MKKILSACLLSASAMTFAAVQEISDEGMKTLGADFVQIVQTNNHAAGIQAFSRKYGFRPFDSVTAGLADHALVVLESAPPAADDGGIPAMLLAVFDDKVQSVAVVGGMEDANVKVIAQHWHCEDVKYAQDVMRMAWCRPKSAGPGAEDVSPMDMRMLSAIMRFYASLP